MSIGGVMVFDPPPAGGASDRRELCASLGPRLGQLPRYFAAALVDPERADSPGRIGSTTTRFRHSRPRRPRALSRRPAARPSCATGRPTSSRTGSTGRARCGRSRWSRGSSTVAGRSAHKTHHCLVDGVGSVDVLSAARRRTEPAESCALAPPPTARTTRRSLRPFCPPHRSRSPAMPSRRTRRRAGVHAAIHPREALERSRALAELIVRDEIIGAPRTSLNVPIGSTQASSPSCARRWPSCKAIRHELGGSVNDVVLAACTSGLRRLLLERGEDLPAQACARWSR